ncbi:MAG: hypothetical protein LBE09_02860, partial [Christensenellaceae bacterium]|nr:hypothetical protein [Christensenellaceae bacterium]
MRDVVREYNSKYISIEFVLNKSEILEMCSELYKSETNKTKQNTKRKIESLISSSDTLEEILKDGDVVSSEDVFKTLHACYEIFYREIGFNCGTDKFPIKYMFHINSIFVYGNYCHIVVTNDIFPVFGLAKLKNYPLLATDYVSSMDIKQRVKKYVVADAITLGLYSDNVLANTRSVRKGDLLEISFVLVCNDVIAVMSEESYEIHDSMVVGEEEFFPGLDELLIGKNCGEVIPFKFIKGFRDISCDMFSGCSTFKYYPDGTEFTLLIYISNILQPFLFRPKLRAQLGEHNTQEEFEYAIERYLLLVDKILIDVDNGADIIREILADKAIYNDNLHIDIPCIEATLSEIVEDDDIHDKLDEYFNGNLEGVLEKSVIADITMRSNLDSLISNLAIELKICPFDGHIEQILLTLAEIGRECIRLSGAKEKYDCLEECVDICFDELRLSLDRQMGFPARASRRIDSYFESCSPVVSALPDLHVVARIKELL